MIKTTITYQGALRTMAEHGPKRRIGVLEVDIHVPIKVSENDQMKLEHVARTCPVYQSLHPDIELPTTFRWGV